MIYQVHKHSAIRYLFCYLQTCIMAIWRRIPGYPNYQASNTGLIRVKKILKITGKLIVITKKSYQRSNCSYKHVRLCKESYLKSFSVHRLIAITFIKNPNNYPCVNHKDGNKHNNYAENLEWVSYSQNMHHAIGMGKCKKKPKKQEPLRFVKSNKDIKIIFKRYKNGEDIGEIATDYNVTKSRIRSYIMRYEKKNGLFVYKPPFNYKHIPQSTWYEILRIYKLGGISIKALAKDYGIGWNTIRRKLSKLDKLTAK